MKNFDKLLIGGLVTTAVISSNYVMSNAENLGESQYTLTNNLNMRKGPDTDYISVGTLKKGNVVTPLEYSQDKMWVKIKYNNQYVWISSKYIKKVESNQSSNKIENYSYKTIERVNLRKGPSTDKTIIVTIPKGSSVKVTGISVDGKWANVTYGNDTGWVSIDYIEKVTNNSNTNTDKPNVDNKDKEYVTVSALNVRKGPSTSYEKIGVLNQNVKIKPLEFDKYGDWVKFKFKNEEGWVCKHYLKELDNTNETNTNNEVKFEKYKALYNLNLRVGPSTSYSVKQQLPKGATFEVIKLSTDKKWANIKYNTTTGWVSYQYIEKVSEITNNTNTEEQNETNKQTLYTSENVNLRSKDSVYGNKICTIPKNAKVSVISYNESKTWAKVIYENKTGWVSATYLKSAQSSTKVDVTTKEGVTTCRLKLRKSPSTTGEVIMTMPAQGNVKIYEEKDGWLKVSYNNITGYCAGIYVK